MFIIKHQQQQNFSNKVFKLLVKNNKPDISELFPRNKFSFCLWKQKSYLSRSWTKLVLKFSPNSGREKVFISLCFLLFFLLRRCRAVECVTQRVVLGWFLFVQLVTFPFHSNDQLDEALSYRSNRQTRQRSYRWKGEKVWKLIKHSLNYPNSINNRAAE